MAKLTKTAAAAEVKEILARGAEIELELAAVKPQIDEKEVLKARMRELAAAFPLLFVTKTRQTIAAENDSVECTVTQGDTPALLDYEGLRHSIDDEVFHQVFKITGATMDLELWNEMVEHEVVLESDLRKHITDGKVPTAAVSFKLKKPKKERQLVATT